MKLEVDGDESYILLSYLYESDISNKNVTHRFKINLTNDSVQESYIYLYDKNTIGFNLNTSFLALRVLKDRSNNLENFTEIIFLKIILLYIINCINVFWSSK